MGLNDLLKIGDKIKELRKKEKISAKEAAKELKIGYSTYSNYENNNRVPGNETLAKIADFYGVSVSYLMGTSKNELDPVRRLSLKAENLNYQLDKDNEEIDELEDTLRKLKDEYDNSSFNTLNDTFLSSLLDDSVVDSFNGNIKELYEDKLEELSGKRLQALSLRGLTEGNLRETSEMLGRVKKGDLYSPSDRINPEFEKHGFSQKAISDRLQSVPYFLNYDCTMKVIEYADMLLEKEENKFKP